MVWLPDSEKKFENIFICFDRMYERDRQKDRQTDGHRMTAKHRAAKIVIKQQKLRLKNFHGSLTTVVRAQNDTSKTANITDTIFDRTYWYSPYKRRRFENQ